MKPPLVKKKAGEAVRGYLPLASRQKIYITLVFACLFLLFYSVWQVYPVIVEEEALLGLASYLPSCYWIGLALLVLTSILAFLDSELKKDAIFILLLLALGLFLFGVKVFFEVNPGNTTVYYPFGEVKNLLVTHHIDISNVSGGVLNSYYSWPAFHFINASILENSGIASSSFLSFVKAMPLYFTLCFVLITYGIGKRLELSPNRCFLLSFLAIASWMPDFAGLYYPRAYAMILFLLLFMLLLVPRRTATETVMMILMFGTAVMMHGLVTLALIPGVVVLAVYRRDFRFVTLFIVILLAWNIYQAPLVVKSGIISLLHNPFLSIFSLADIERYQQPALMSTIVARYTRIPYAISYIALMVGCTILLIRSIKGERKKQVISLYVFAIGVLAITVLGTGESIWRAYIYDIVPALAIVALLLPRRKIMTALTIALMCLFTFLHLPANYSGESQWGQIQSYQLKGTEFFATRVKLSPGEILFQPYGGELFWYYNSSLAQSLPLPDSAALMYTFYKSRETRPYLVEPTNTLDRIAYVVISRHGAYLSQFDLRDWPQTEAGGKANLIYNNGGLQIYDNYMWR